MTKPYSDYPNKADFEPNVDKHLKEGQDTGELPLADPAESNTTKEFRENETATEGEQRPSAFNENINNERK